MEEDAVLVEAEAARCYRESVSHKQLCDTYAAKGKPLQWMEHCFY